MTKTQFDQICNELVEIIRERAPRKSGNLRDFGVQFVWEDEKTFTIYIDESEAPYMKYTNENWNNFRPPLQGKKNPNEAWWQDAIQLCLDYFTSQLKGEIK